MFLVIVFEKYKNKMRISLLKKIIYHHQMTNVNFFLGRLIYIAIESKNEDEAKDRVMRDVVAQPRFPLLHNKLSTSIGRCILFSEICKEIFKKEPNLLSLKDPIAVCMCKDVYGQFFDLLERGEPADTQYLFLGDYVDGGCFSCDCVFFLCAHKIKDKC
ncbi:hypothetical protein RFI_06106 [Reticulomyxa filosa]|uniref:Uncharacterized protein n=1 Tax=Reticulomyxa filosa TaxID=46433 RepID=X6NYU9_RETFI|nr:hypothetical protein RFI_06106 [Reticulomyxa filosa]|eukprot:ETO31014.1 hypothetical protein RFI_06106 [Reticulomyxa filosa]